jgi:hypothetical protein
MVGCSEISIIVMTKTYCSKMAYSAKVGRIPEAKGHCKTLSIIKM